jgi:hypothetical protein
MSGIRTVVLLALLLACGAAQAADLVSVGKNDGGKKETFVDVSSIRVEGEIRRGLSTVVLAPHTQNGGGDYSSKWISHIAYSFAFNCVERTGRVEGFNFYFEDGTNYIDPAAHYPKPWQKVPPDTDSNWTTLMQFICAWKQK